MATTSRGIPLLDGSSKVAPFQAHYNGIANALNTALNTLESSLKPGANFYKGTSTQRASFLSQATEGDAWMDTNGTKDMYIKRGSSWSAAYPPNPTVPKVRSGWLSVVDPDKDGKLTDVTFPAGSFDGVPAVQVCLANGITSATMGTCWVSGNPTKDGFIVGMTRSNSNATNIRWLAIGN